jgi:SAM-dependent methyltransferase
MSAVMSELAEDRPGIETRASMDALLTGEDYVRERIDPRPADPEYLVLSDLLMGIRELAPVDAARVLDYGCGGSPYRQLFSAAVYHRADLTGSDLDFTFGSDARLPSEIGCYDCVLSTQVLEHVVDPVGYLAEAFRVTRPGGKLLLTTHGTFEDHACPHDYWRWTADGLRRLAEGAGFEVITVKKMTTGPRAVVRLIQRDLPRLRFGRSGPYGKMLSLGARVVQRLGRKRMHLAADRNLSGYRLVDARESGDHGIYICVGVLAQRPTG